MSNGMKVRMRTVYIVNGFEGDCPEWAAEARAMGQQVQEVRTAWLGKPWSCHCISHKHSVSA